MIFSINKLMTSVPILVCRDTDRVEEITNDNPKQVSTLTFVPFFVLNPTSNQPHVAGVIYAYSLLPITNDMLVPLDMLKPFPGLNSTLDLPTVDFVVGKTYTELLNAVYSFFIRPSGIVEPMIKNRVVSSANRGLSNFHSFINSGLKNVEEVINGSNKIDALLYRTLREKMNVT